MKKPFIMKALVTMLILCILMVTGCGKSITERYDDKKLDGIMDVQDYGVEQLAFDDGGMLINYGVNCYKNGVLYYVANSGVNENNECTYYIHAYDIAKEKDSIAIELNTNNLDKDIKVKTIWGIVASDNGNLTIYPEWEILENDMQLSFGVLKVTYNTEGEEIARNTLELPEGIDDTDMLNPYCSRCYESYDGCTYISINVGNSFYHIKYDKDNKLLGMVKVDNEFDCGYLDNLGNMVVCADSEKGKRCGYVDYIGKSVDTEMFKELNEKNLGISLVGIDDRNIFLIDDKYVYEYDCNSRQMSRLIDLDRCGIGRDYIEYLCRIDEDRLVCLAQMENGSELFVFNKNLTVVEKETVKIAGMTRNDGELIAAINEYNREEHEYRIEFVCYEDSGSEGMMKDIMSDSAPDIYLLENMDIDNLISRNLLEDLMPYIKNDDVLNTNYFIDGFTNKTGNDGKQYVLMKRFCINALLGLEKYTRKLVNYSSNDMSERLMELYESKPTDAVFISGTCIGESAGVGMYELIVSSCSSEFLDCDTGNSSFDSEGLKQILELCRKVEESYDDEISLESDKNLSDEKIMLDNRYIWGLNDIQYNDIICEGNASYLGYPMTGNIYMKCVGSTFAMSSVSDKKEVAWDIIKELMTGSYRKWEHGEDNYGIPVAKAEFDMMIEEAMTTEEYIAEDGTKIYPHNVVMANNISYGPASKKDGAVLSKLIEDAVYYKDNKKVSEVTTAVAEQYIKGNKSLEDTVSIIQDKMTKYVNENR